MAACPRLTELSILCPHPHLHPHDFRFSEAGIPLGPVRTAHSEIIELVNGCKELPDFDTLQIIHFSLNTSDTGRGLEGGKVNRLPLMNQVSREQAEGMKDWVLERLKEPRTGCEGNGRKKKMLRIVELSSFLTHLGYHYRTKFRPGPVKVEEYEVWGVGSDSP